MGTPNENINGAQCYKSADYREGFSMTYHMRDVKNLKPSLVEESLAKALLCFALAMSATALALVLGALAVCK